MSLFIQLYNWILYDILGFSIDLSSEYLLQPLALLMTYMLIIALIIILFKLLFWALKYIKGFMP